MNGTISLNQLKNFACNMWDNSYIKNSMTKAKIGDKYSQDIEDILYHIACELEDYNFGWNYQFYYDFTDNYWCFEIKEMDITRPSFTLVINKDDDNKILEINSLKELE